MVQADVLRRGSPFCLGPHPTGRLLAMKYRASISLSALLLVSLACAAKQKDAVDSQSRLMDQTFAGQNACNPDDHLRPFIIEWDATDMSSFESLAADDVVVVRYEGCSLKVLDECRNSSVRGENGAYLPPTWTSGSLETLDIQNEGDLYAKLPLGQATLGGRVSGGEKFHMEYYVAGTRNATRDALYRNEIADNPGCEGATHFVYGYNLGAFALGSATELSTEFGGSAFGFGAGGSTSNKRNAEKKGGDLATCKSDEATEVMGCKAPIRLTLRAIRDGENPDAEAMKAPDTPESLNAAGLVNMKVEMSDEARAHYDAAIAKMNSRDGKGCLIELDLHDNLDPDHKSTDPKQAFAAMRGQCLMLAGKCGAGKDLVRKYFESTMLEQWGPEQVDKTVDAYMSMHCQGKMKPREAVLQALAELQKGAYMTKKPASFCTEHLATIEKHRKTVKPKDDEDHQIIDLDRNIFALGPACYGRAGDCDKAFALYKKVNERINPGVWDKMDAKTRSEVERSSFESLVQKCKSK